MPVAIVGKGLGMVAATPSPASAVTPPALAASYRLLNENGSTLTAENSNRLRTETDG